MEFRRGLRREAYVVEMRLRNEDILKRNDMITRLHTGNSLADRLYDTSTLMTENDGEGTFGILAGERVCI
jgi:hypothetical protein